MNPPGGAGRAPAPGGCCGGGGCCGAGAGPRLGAAGAA